MSWVTTVEQHYPSLYLLEDIHRLSSIQPKTQLIVNLLVSRARSQVTKFVQLQAVNLDEIKFYNEYIRDKEHVHVSDLARKLERDGADSSR